MHLLALLLNVFTFSECSRKINLSNMNFSETLKGICPINDVQNFWFSLKSFVNLFAYHINKRNRISNAIRWPG